MSIDQRQNELIEEFSMFDDWMEKYEYIIDLGKDLESLTDDLFSKPVCGVWVNKMPQDKLFFASSLPVFNQ